MPVELATLAQLKAALAGTGGVTQKDINDARLQRLLDEHTGIFVEATDRSFDPNPPLDNTGRDTAPDVTVTIHVRRRKVVPVPDARVLTTITLDGVTLVEDCDYDTITQNGVIVSVTLHRLYHDYAKVLTVTGRFGIWPTPSSVTGAVIEMAARAYKSQDARYADVVVMPDGSSASYYKTLPPRAQMTVNNYALTVSP